MVEEELQQRQATEAQQTDRDTDSAPPAALAVNAAQKEEISSARLARQLGPPREEPKASGTWGRAVL